MPVTKKPLPSPVSVVKNGYAGMEAASRTKETARSRLRAALLPPSFRKRIAHQDVGERVSIDIRCGDGHGAPRRAVWVFDGRRLESLRREAVGRGRTSSTLVSPTVRAANAWLPSAATIGSRIVVRVDRVPLTVTVVGFFLVSSAVRTRWK